MAGDGCVECVGLCGDILSMVLPRILQSNFTSQPMCGNEECDGLNLAGRRRVFWEYIPLYVIYSILDGI